jgi:hypothetical protein
MKPLQLARFLSGLLAALLLLAGCASTPEEPVEPAEPMPVEEPMPMVEPAPEPVVELKPDYPEEYIVVKGDTLWDISARFLKSPWQWPQLWQFNPQVKNPHLIYPGDVLTIYFIDGKPVMRVQRDGKTVIVPAAEEPVPEEMLGKRYPTVKLSPRVREYGLEEAIPTIPLDAIKHFLTRPKVVTEDELEQAPYVMEFADEHMAAGGGYRVYARGIEEDDITGDYILVRSGQTYRDPQTDEVLGYEAVYLGEARLQRYGDPSTLLVQEANREILRGDRLVPKGDDLYLHSYMPRGPQQPVKGQIIAVLDGVAQIGQYQVVVLNLGRQEDIEPGHVLAVSQRGKEVKDTVAGGRVTLPDERAGEVMVFRVFERVSYALVMSATRAMHTLDIVTNP